MPTRSPRKNIRSSSGSIKSLLFLLMTNNFLHSDDSDMTGGNHKMFENTVVTGMEYPTPKKPKLAEDNLSMLSFPASNHSEEYMDYLGMINRYTKDDNMYPSVDASKVPKIEPDMDLKPTSISITPSSVSSPAPAPPATDLKLERPPKADIQNKANKTCSVCQVKICNDFSPVCHVHVCLGNF